MPGCRRDLQEEVDDHRAQDGQRADTEEGEPTAEITLRGHRVRGKPCPV